MGNDQVANWAQIVGIAVPFIAALILRADWSSEVKAVITMVIALVCGVVSVGLAGGFDGGITWQSWTTQVLAVYAAAQIVYVALKNPLKRIEQATTPQTVKGTVTARSDDTAAPVEGHGLRRPKRRRDDT